jgi:hypothetical protein
LLHDDPDQLDAMTLRNVVVAMRLAVDAALSGLDQGETVAIPSLEDPPPWQAFSEARAAPAPHLSRRHAARRYGAKPRETAST